VQIIFAFFDSFLDVLPYKVILSRLNNKMFIPKNQLVFSTQISTIYFSKPLFQLNKKYLFQKNSKPSFHLKIFISNNSRRPTNNRSSDVASKFNQSPKLKVCLRAEVSKLDGDQKIDALKQFLYYSAPFRLHFWDCLLRNELRSWKEEDTVFLRQKRELKKKEDDGLKLLCWAMTFGVVWSCWGSIFGTLVCTVWS
jgi:hypothetical protein